MRHRGSQYCYNIIIIAKVMKIIMNIIVKMVDVAYHNILRKGFN